MKFIKFSTAKNDYTRAWKLYLFWIIGIAFIITTVGGASLTFSINLWKFDISFSIGVINENG